MSAHIVSSKTPGFAVSSGFGAQRPRAGTQVRAKDLKSFIKTFAQPAKQAEMTGLVFQPFSEVKSELSTVGSTPATSSFAKVEFNEECEAAINEQINIEYTISYVYHALHAFFDRDNVGLPGFAQFFDEASKEEREHAQLLIEYQNKRGGRVQLKVSRSQLSSLYLCCATFEWFLQPLAHNAATSPTWETMTATTTSESTTSA